LQTTTERAQAALTAAQEKLDSARTEQQTLQNDVNRLRERKMALSRKQLEVERVTRAQSETEAENQTLRGRLADAEGALEPLKARVAALQAERETARGKHESLAKTATQDLQAIEGDARLLHGLVADIASFDTTAGDRQAQAAAVQDAMTKVKSARADAESLRGTLLRKKKKVFDSEKALTDVRAAVHYRTKRAALATHDGQKGEREEALRDLTGQSDVRAGISAKRATLERGMRQRAELKGSVKALDTQIKDLRREFEQPKYERIAEKHRKKLVEVQTNLCALSDLDKYYKALDKALMHFHSERMREINRTLKEYWHATYQGKDIDEVSILSEFEGDDSTTRRIYNYRVVMKQGDAELDMRGRCSAGQKVLTCLLIRLALADTFCLRCGLLALDEPTTNLDHGNIKAFARQLNGIIEKRKAQSNFQLIVITHDEEFVEEIGKREHADHYFRVYKDDRHHSRIKRQPIRD
jgi:DNA repair protein RAD50